MGEEQDGRGNEIQPIRLPRQRRNDDIKNQRQVSNIRNVFSCFEKGVQRLSRAFTFIRNLSYRGVAPWNWRTWSKWKKKKQNKTNTITVNFNSSIATHLHVNALVPCYFLNCVTMSLCPVYLIRYIGAPFFISSGVRVILLNDTSRWYSFNILNRINLYFKSSICFYNRFVFQSQGLIILRKNIT